MHGNGPITDEQGAGDLAVDVALDQEGQHVRFAVGQVEPERAAVGPAGETAWLVRLARRPSSLARVSSGAAGRWLARLSHAARARAACSRRPARTAAPASCKRAYA